MRKNPAAVNSNIKRITLLAKKGQNTEALRQYYSATAKLPDTVTNHLKFGRLAMNLSLLTEAENQFNAALKLKQDDIASLSELAKLHTSRGHVSDALTILEQIIKYDTEHEFARKYKKYLLNLVKFCGLNIVDINKTEPVYFPGIAFDAIINKLLQHYPSKYVPVPKRLAFVIFNMRLGGIQKKVAGIIHHLQSAHGETEHVKLFCKSLSQLNDDAFLLPLYKQYGIDIEEYAPAAAKPAFDRPLLEDYAGLLSKIYIVGADIANLASALIEYKPEVVHAFGYQAAEFGIAAAIAGVPRIILHSGNMRPGSMSSASYWQDHVRTMGHAYQALVRLPNITITNNCQAASTDYEQWLELPAGQVQVIYNGVDFDTLNNTDHEELFKLRGSLGIPAASPVIGSAIRFVTQKRPYLWLKTAILVAEARPDIHFILAGDGPLIQEFKQEIRSLNLSDRFHLPGAVLDMRPWYELMDIVLLTSSMEGTSNVAIEAQYLGIPVVSTNTGGMNETILHGKSGWLVDPPVAEQIAEKIFWILEHPQWCREAGRIGRDFVIRRFSMEKLIRRILDLSRE